MLMKIASFFFSRNLTNKNDKFIIVAHKIALPTLEDYDSKGPTEEL